MKFPVHPGFEVSKDSVVTGPCGSDEILRKLRKGDLLPEDLYRKKGASHWQPIAMLWRWNKRFMICFWIIETFFFVGVGLFLMHFSLQIADIAAASSSWPSVEGKITYAKVAYTGSGDEGLGFRYRPTVQYRYDVGSKKFFGECISPGFGIGSQSWAQSIIDRHPEGSTCRVYYRPGHMWFSVLEPGLSPHIFQIFAVGSIAIYLGILFGCLGIKTAFQKASEPPLKLSKRLLYLGLGSLPVILGVVLIRWFL